MASYFDHEDESSWYFGAIGRQEATEVLNNEREGGVFLVRDSASCVGDYVLCVKEDCRVSHYIINKTQQNDQTIKYRIGDRFFRNIPELLSFYKLHYLDTTPLIRPASKRLEKVIAKYDFESQEKDDLSFKKGDILTIILKEEEQWWKAKNKDGKEGSIPVPYVQLLDETQTVEQQLAPPRPGSGGPIGSAPETTKKNQMQRKLPAKARVKQVRIPNAYDDTALKLEVGDIITVLKTNINGQWEGELNGRIGYFPFTHVEFLDEEDGS